MWCLAKAEIEIDAPVDVVWSVVIDAGRYPEWNPFMPRIEGAFEPEARVKLHVALVPGRPPRRDPERIESVVPNSELVWSSLLFPRWLMSARREQRLEMITPGRTRYITREEAGGPLGLIAWLVARANVQRGFDVTAKALRQRAESLHSTVH